MMAHVLRVAVHPDVAAGAPRRGPGAVWGRRPAALPGRVGPCTPPARPGLAGARERIGAACVAYVGVLHPRKNLGALREAMARLPARGAPHSLAVVWSPPADRADPAALVRDALAELPGAPGRLVALRDLDDEALAAVLAGAHP